MDFVMYTKSSVFYTMQLLLRLTVSLQILPRNDCEMYDSINYGIDVQRLDLITPRPRVGDRGEEGSKEEVGLNVRSDLL